MCVFFWSKSISNNNFTWQNFDIGRFYGNDTDDIFVGDGVANTVYYCLNTDNNNIQGPVAINFIYNNYNTPVKKFKIRQIDDKAFGYAQNDPSNRSDIIFISKDQTTNNNNIYVYTNNQSGSFNSQPFANFQTDPYYPAIGDLEVADINGDGYNDIITISNVQSCPTYFYAEAFKNVQGALINPDPVWTYALNPTCALNCGYIPKVLVADLDKDGLNDLIIVMDRIDGYTGTRVLVFLNKLPNEYFSDTPDQDISYSDNGMDYGCITKAVISDIYGGQSHDGGGFALLLSYMNQGNGLGNPQYYVKVINATQQYQQSPPPPPICQGLLKFYYHDPNTGGDYYHPHLHLDNRGERDFSYYRIYKWKLGDPGYTRIEDNYIDTGFTDFTECVYEGGQDRPFPNCCYYATQVDNLLPIGLESKPSQTACYGVGDLNGCPIDPSCFNCSPGDHVNLINKDSINNKKSKIRLPEKFSISNYPNPFNPTTKINYDLPKPAKVVVVVYDILGRLVKELVNDYKDAGFYNVSFDGTNLASGIYFYKIQAFEIKGKNYVQTGRMLLLK